MRPRILVYRRPRGKKSLLLSISLTGGGEERREEEKKGKKTGAPGMRKIDEYYNELERKKREKEKT